jgi:hypothetical protein
MCVGGLLASLGCCFTSAACSLCCAGCPSCRNSTATRIAYGLIIIVATIVSLVCMAPELKTQLAKIESLCQNVGQTSCVDLVGYFAVYRIMFAMTIFFVLMALLMIGVKTSKDKRAAIQNGFWAPKVLLLIGIAVAAFFIPQGTFEDVWMYFGLVGGFCFIVIQLILLIDFAYCWNENWVSRMEDQGRTWFYLLLGATLSLITVCVVMAVLMFVFYAGGGCGLNKFFVLFNLGLCLVVCVISILPKVQEENPSSGLLQASVVSMYVMFLTWCAMTAGTRTGCNPSITQMITGDDTPTTGSHIDLANIMSLALWVLLVMYSSVSNASKIGGSAADQEGGGFLRMEATGDSDDAESAGQKVVDDEEEAVAYNYTYFHLVLATAALYIMMCLTNWLDPSGDIYTFQHSAAAMWVKIVSSWVCIVLYGWTMVAPILLSGRDFS